jgi:hypothetical protein
MFVCVYFVVSISCVGRELTLDLSPFQGVSQISDIFTFSEFNPERELAGELNY